MDWLNEAIDLLKPITMEHLRDLEELIERTNDEDVKVAVSLALASTGLLIKATAEAKRTAARAAKSRNN